MRIVLAQINPKVGDLKNNADSMVQVIEFCQSRAEEIDLIVFPELSLTGYPPKDLLFQQSFIIETWETLNERVIPFTNIPTLIGVPSPTPNKKSLFNSAVLIENKNLKTIIHKKLLPNYEVFNESRYFTPGRLSSDDDLIINVKGHRVAVLICEDLLSTDEDKYDLSQSPINFLAKQKLDLVVCLSASPYRFQQPEQRIKLAKTFQSKVNCPVALVNQVGANDDLIFDGSSFLIGAHGKLLQTVNEFKEEIIICNTASNENFSAKSPRKPVLELREALVLGIKDYFRKTGFKKAFLGLSGGVDSALVACLAVEALGKENVKGIMMPSKYSSEGSINDSQELIKNLGIEGKQIEIENILNSFLSETGLQSLTLAEENLQSRIRGNILMALANEEKALVLATGNKSEFSVGYSTLYGDMCGALAPIGDLWKTQVWEMAASFPEIPKQIISKPPSAELRPDQLDSDSLPDYAILDEILKGYIENGLSEKELQSKGLPIDAIKKALHLHKISEFKRRQAPIILKVSYNTFGSGWIYAVAAK